MTRNMTLLEMAAALAAAATAVEAGEPAVLRLIGERVRDRARSYLGVPQTVGHGGFAPWAPLADSTLDRKGENTPGLESGALGESIEFQVTSSDTVQIGTNILSDRGAPYGKYFEEGRAGQPPRPFLHPAAVEIVEKMLGAIGPAVIESIGDAGLGFYRLVAEA